MAITRSPTAKPVTPSPSSATSPAASSPALFRALPPPVAGRGYAPRRWARSARLSPVARTRTNSSPGRGVGSGASRYSSVPPSTLAMITMAFIPVLLVGSDALLACSFALRRGLGQDSIVAYHRDHRAGMALLCAAIQVAYNTPT